MLMEVNWLEVVLMVKPVVQLGVHRVISVVRDDRLRLSWLVVGGNFTVNHVVGLGMSGRVVSLDVVTDSMFTNMIVMRVLIDQVMSWLQMAKMRLMAVIIALQAWDGILDE